MPGLHRQTVAFDPALEIISQPVQYLDQPQGREPQRAVPMFMALPGE
jgi:hypothetical protein